MRPDWEDGRRKWVSISPSGSAARDRAIAAIAPVFDDAVAGLGLERMRTALPILRRLRELWTRIETSPQLRGTARVHAGTRARRLLRLGQVQAEAGAVQGGAAGELRAR